MSRVQLTDHFYLDEFTRSETAARFGRLIVVPLDGTVFFNLRKLCELILEPLRDNVGASIHVTSGYRPDWLNKQVRGSSKSQHTRGLAADIVVDGHNPLLTCHRIITLNLPYDQLIYEFGVWTHVSVAAEPALPRGKVLTAQRIATNGKLRTLYKFGLPSA